MYYVIRYNNEGEKVMRCNNMAVAVSAMLEVVQEIAEKSNITVSLDTVCKGMKNLCFDSEILGSYTPEVVYISETTPLPLHEWRKL